MLFLVGIDDTDNKDSIQTANLAEQLGLKLEARRLARLVSVTSHQLFIHPDIHNSTNNNCACLLLDTDSEKRRELELYCREFLLRESAVGADPGFALASWSDVSPEITTWGHLAKESILNRLDAIKLARENKISIAGFTGSGDGVIGALAAVGLFFDGNDGHFLWLPGLHLLKGIIKLGDLFEFCKIDRVENVHGRQPFVNDKINLGEGVHPLIRNSKSLLLVCTSIKGEPYEWSVCDKDQGK